MDDSNHILFFFFFFSVSFRSSRPRFGMEEQLRIKVEGILRALHPHPPRTPQHEMDLHGSRSSSNNQSGVVKGQDRPTNKEEEEDNRLIYGAVQPAPTMTGVIFYEQRQKIVWNTSFQQNSPVGRQVQGQWVSGDLVPAAAAAATAVVERGSSKRA